MTKRNVIVISHNPANFEAGIARAAELTAGLDRSLLIAELYNANREIAELKNELEVARRHAVPCECRGGTPASTEPAADHHARLAAGTDARCPKCGTKLSACDTCGKPAMCGDAWCAECAPDEPVSLAAGTEEG